MNSLTSIISNCIIILHKIDENVNNYDHDITSYIQGAIWTVWAEMSYGGQSWAKGVLDPQDHNLYKVIPPNLSKRYNATSGKL